LDMILSFYFLCSNPAIERVDHFPLGLERKLVRAVEKQCVEPPDRHCRPKANPERRVFRKAISVSISFPFPSNKSLRGHAVPRLQGRELGALGNEKIAGTSRSGVVQKFNRSPA